MSEQMEAINKEKLSYFTNLAHEFKTPLTLIQGPASQLVRQTTDPKEKRTYRLSTGTLNTCFHWSTN